VSTFPLPPAKATEGSKVWKYSYNAQGYVTGAVAPDGATTSYTYATLTLMPASQTDANGNTTAYQYDSMGNLIRQTDALGFVTIYTYEPVFNQVTSVTDPNGRTKTYTYDARGNRLQAADPLGGIETWAYDVHGNVMTYTDKNGNATGFTYDGFGNRVTTTDPMGNITTMGYDTVGNLISRVDANNHTTIYLYDALDRAILETDPLGKTTTTVYDGQGNRTQVIDRNGNATTYQYDLRSRLTKVTDALSQTTTATYDGNSNIVSTTDKNGHTTVYVYDSRNRLIKTVDALGNTGATAFDAVGNKVKETDGNGHSILYSYDALNRMVTSTDAVGSVTTTLYDSTGPNTGPCTGVCTGPTKGSSLPSKRTDGNGKVVYYKYDGLDRQIQEVRKQGSTSDVEPPNPSDAVTYTTYDAMSNVLTMTEPDGNTMTFGYDADNRKTRQTNAAGDLTTTTYDPVGNIASLTAPTTNVTTYTYDGDDRRIQVQDGGGTVAIYTYDPVGNQLTRTDGNGLTTTTTYDTIYRITQATDPLGQNSRYAYDPVGNLLSMTDRNGNVTSYAYDAINRRTSETDALGNTTRYQYDPVGNLTVLTDANGHGTRYAYDGVNRRSNETYADGRSRTYAYDFVGNLTSRTDQNALTTQYTYSDLYFLSNRTYPISPADTFIYDLSGRMLSATRGGWVVTFSYDGADRVLQSVQNGETVSYSYNIPARTRTVSYPGGRTLTESLDLRSRLSRIDDLSSVTPIVQYSYDAADNVAQRAYRNGTNTAYAYNADYWVLNLQHNFMASPIAGFTYAYDNEGNKLYEQKLQDTTHSEAYQYDTTYRVVAYQVGTLVGSTIPMPSTQTQYTLDAVGNWTKKVSNAIPETRTHNAVNEITAINGMPLSYDNNGNLTADTLYTYAYDEENRLIAVTRKSDSALVGQYQYDALSRRVQKIANPAGVATTTRYFYDGARTIEEQDGGGITQATYVYGNYIDEVLTMDRAAQTYYYHQNALWSIEAITNSAGTPVERYRYDVYGFVTVTDGSGNPVPPNSWTTPHSAISNPWMFTGRQLDEETGLYFYRARYYDTNKGRFLQRDPLEYVDGMNLYEYVGGGPTAWLDPSGQTLTPQSVGGGPQIGFNDAGVFFAWWGVSLYADEQETKKLQNAGGGAIVSQRDIEWEIKCCDTEQTLIKAGQRSDWFLDVITFNGGKPKADADYSTGAGGPKLMETKEGQRSIALSYFQPISFSSDENTQGKVKLKVGYSMVVGQLAAAALTERFLTVGMSWKDRQKAMSAKLKDVTMPWKRGRVWGGLGYQDYAHKPFSEVDVMVHKLNPETTGSFELEIEWTCDHKISVKGTPISGGPQRLGRQTVRPDWVWTPSENGKEWQPPAR